MYLHLGNQRLIKGVIGPRIFHPHLEDIIDIPRQPVRLLHFGTFLERCQKLSLPIRIMFRCADQDKETGLETQRLGVQQNGLLADDSRLAHLADSVPDRGLG